MLRNKKEVGSRSNPVRFNLFIYLFIHFIYTLSTARFNILIYLFIHFIYTLGTARFNLLIYLFICFIYTLIYSRNYMELLFQSVACEDWTQTACKNWRTLVDCSQWRALPAVSIFYSTAVSRFFIFLYSTALFRGFARFHISILPRFPAFSYFDASNSKGLISWNRLQGTYFVKACGRDLLQNQFLRPGDSGVQLCCCC